VATHEHLQFQLDHALARDAVHTPLDTDLLERGLRERGLTPLLLRSKANDRKTYLRRPDLGRTLHPDSVATLQSTTNLDAPRLDSETWVGAAQNPRILFLLADGLSALALERHALPLLDATLPLLEPCTLNLVPVVQNARVALADQIGTLLGAQITVLLIGERPGLSSPDSLGCYITWNPQPGITTDAERNCISNIRGDEGLGYAEAAHRIAHYIAEAQRLQTTGVALKDPEVDQRGRHSLRG
jgi:ethanolamine ammonia-lyase small subunit